MDTLVQDLKYVLRTLGRRPAFTLAVLLTLGLGIAANTAIFSVLNGVLLQPLPFESPEDLVTPDVMSTRGFYISTSIPNYYDWKDRSRSFESFGAYMGTSAVLTGLDRPEVVRIQRVLGDFFEVLGVGAAMGRTVTAQEAEPGAVAMAVLSHRFWRDQLAGDSQVLGRTLILDDTPFEVVGVMPADFVFPSPEDDIYVPMGYFAEGMPWDDRGSSSGTRAVARLLPGVSIDLAQTDLDRITAAIRETEETAAAPILVSLTERYLGDVRAPLWTMMGAVAFVLLIACANVANLLLARGEGRQKELALRSALGAKRNRVVRQLLTESLVLGLSGGMLGIALAYVAVFAMKGALPTSLPGLVVGRVSIDPTVLMFTLALSLITGLIFGFVPALRSSTPDLVSTLKEGGRGGAGVGGHRMKGALVVTEVGLSLVLLAGAGLLIKRLDSLHQVDKGFDETNVLTMRVPLSGSKYPEEGNWQAFNDELLGRIGSMPGVQHAAVANFVPLSGRSWENSISPEGVDIFDPDNRQSVLNTIASVDYLETLGIEIFRGRGFTSADDAENPLVIVVDESMAEKFWPGEDPIGKRVTMEWESVRGTRLARQRAHLPHRHWRGEARATLRAAGALPNRSLPTHQAVEPLVGLLPDAGREELRRPGRPSRGDPERDHHHRPGSAGPGRENDVRGDRLAAGELHGHAGPSRHLRDVGPRSGRHRYLRRHVVLGGSARTRGRHPNGPGCRSESGPMAHIQARSEARPLRTWTRNDRRPGGDPLPAEPLVRRGYHRAGHAAGRFRDPHGGGPPGGLHSGSAGDPNRSGGSAARGVGATHLLTPLRPGAIFGAENRTRLRYVLAGVVDSVGGLVTGWAEGRPGPSELDPHGPPSGSKTQTGVVGT